MATSDSEDFESADEGFDGEDSPKKKPDTQVVKPTGQKSGEPEPQPTHKSQETFKQEEPVADSAWEPEDLDDDILDSISDKIDDEEPVTQINDSVKELSNADAPCPVAEPVSNKSKESIDTHEVKSESTTLDNTVNVEPLEPESKGSRPRRVREAKAIVKVASAGSKKLGSKLATPVLELKPEAEEDETQNTNLEQLESKSNLADKTARSCSEELDELPKKPDDVDQRRDKEPEKPAVSSVFDKLSSTLDQQPEESSGWGSWGGWGTSLLSTATSSVSSLSSHVISTVIDTVESGLGAPDPVDIAREQLAAATVKEPPVKEEEDAKTEEKTAEPESSGFPLGNWMSGVSHLGKMVESTTSKVMTGGLDTLENIGKRTMQVLQDGDPGLKKKRAMFGPDKPVLSQALREAKEMADQDEKAVEEKLAARKVHFETLFDDFQGLVHLEALEMLSRQCEMKLQSSLLKLSGPELKTVHEKLLQIRDESILPSTDDIEEPVEDMADAVKENVAALPVKVSSDKLLKIWSALQTNEEESYSLNEQHAMCMSTLAEMTSLCVEIFHRVGELLTVNETRNPFREAELLQKLTINLTFMVEKTATILCDKLNEKHGDAAQPTITKVFLEAFNSSTYIQDAFQLLMPVLQQAALY